MIARELVVLLPHIPQKSQAISPDSPSFVSQCTGLTDAERQLLLSLECGEVSPIPSRAEDYHQLTAAEQLEILQLQHEILATVVQSREYMDVLCQICRLEERLLPDSVASVMLLDEQQRLNILAAPSISSEVAARFNGLCPGPYAGSCGNAVYRRGGIFVSNTLIDPRWKDLRPLAQELGILSCWSVPIWGLQGRLLGTFALSSFVHREPSIFHRKALEIAAAIVGVVLDRQFQTEHLNLLGKVFEGSNQAIMITGRRAHIQSVNQAFVRMTGYQTIEVQGRRPNTQLLISDRHGPAFYSSLWRTLLRRNYWQGEIWIRRKNQEVFPAWLSLTLVRAGQEQEITHVVGFFFDISEQKATEERLAFLTGHDVLTGLPNRLILRTGLSQILMQAERRHHRVALLYLDLDGFKSINASFGELGGDELLRMASHRIADLLDDGVTLARLDSDEFAIVLPTVTDLQQVSALAERVLNSFVQPFQIFGTELDCTLSVGIALYPEDALDQDSLLKSARNAMEHAKRAGRNTYHFYAEFMNTHTDESLILRNSLRQALARGEFFLEYQPQIDLVSGRIIGAEALVRWMHPERGRIGPVTFIELAEQCGVIIPLGEWVLQEACRQGAIWHQQGYSLVIAVNLSSVQFKRGNLEHSVVQALSASGLPAHLLELELTESILIENTTGVLNTVQRLKSLGIKLSIDDFGTGYSSLAYLTRLAVDKLKVDQSFVRFMTEVPANAAIIRAIIQMAHSLGLKAIAEGVENDRARQFLLANHCDEAQGYWFSKPVSAQDFVALLEAEEQRDV